VNVIVKVFASTNVIVGKSYFPAKEVPVDPSITSTLTYC
jgi:hypothetical protein